MCRATTTFFLITFRYSALAGVGVQDNFHDAIYDEMVGDYDSG